MKLMLLGAVLSGAALAQAEIVPIDSFSGQFNEGFETGPVWYFQQMDVFGNGSRVISLGDAHLIRSPGWELHGPNGYIGTIYPHGGGYFMGGSLVNYRFAFAGDGVRRFGGFFGTNCGYPGAAATFYDTNGMLMAENVPVADPNGSWSWNGWVQNNPAGPAIGMLDILAVPPNPYGGFVMCDDLTYDPWPGGPAVCRGDCNCDGEINFADINPFVAALSGGTPCSIENCDVNGDSHIDFGDINPFVALLSGGAHCQ